jgi:sugar phosphate isomerase/epimerase
MSDISYQLYSSRNFPPLADTLTMLKTLGYENVEGFGGLFSDLGAVKAGFEETGLRMPSSHFGLDMLESDPDSVLSIAEALGIGVLFCPHIAPELRPADAAGWRAFGQRLETAGAPFREAGLRFGWHNHDFEFKALGDGSKPMTHILEGGPSLEWQADIAWIVRGGDNPFHWIQAHGNRIGAVHVKDIAAAGECADEDGWADVGHGTMDWRRLIAALRSTGATLLVMEHDNPNDHERFARRSVASMLQLQG